MGLVENHSETIQDWDHRESTTFPIGPPEWKSNSSFCPAIVLSPSRIPNMGSVAEISPILKELMLPILHQHDPP